MSAKHHQRQFGLRWPVDLRPMLLRPGPLPSGEGWAFELKWDGFRAIAERDHAGHVSLYSRNYRDFAKRFPPIVEAMSALKRAGFLTGK